MKILKGCAIEGGGSKGALTAGRLEERNEDYDAGSGISTGALMIILVLLKYWRILGPAYTSLNTRDITEVSAFNKKGRPKIARILWRMAKGKKTAGESKNLRNLIDSFIDDRCFDDLVKNNKIAMVSAYSLTRCELVDFLTNQFKHPRDFKDFIWASANAGPAMSILNKTRPGSRNVEQWTDGGFEDGHTANKLFDVIYQKNEAQILQGKVSHIEVDLFLHRERPKYVLKKNVQNIPHFILRYIKARLSNNKKDDLAKAIMAAKAYNGVLRVHYLPSKLTSNSLVFNKDRMLNWYSLGKRIAFDNRFIDTFDFRDGKNSYK